MSFLDQFSVWEIVVGLILILVVNTVVFKLLVDWNQSQPPDDGEPSVATTHGTMSLPTDKLETVPSFAAGSVPPANRPRRRKYLQDPSVLTLPTPSGTGRSASPESPDSTSVENAPLISLPQTQSSEVSAPAEPILAATSAEDKPHPVITLPLIPQLSFETPHPPAEAPAVLEEVASFDATTPLNEEVNKIDEKPAIPPASEFSPVVPPLEIAPASILEEPATVLVISPAEITAEPPIDILPVKPDSESHPFEPAHPVDSASSPASHDSMGVDDITPSADLVISPELPAEAKTSDAPSPALPPLRPAIRRGVAPARLFLTREFSSVRIRSRPATPPEPVTVVPESVATPVEASKEESVPIPMGADSFVPTAEPESTPAAPAFKHEAGPAETVPETEVSPTPATHASAVPELVTELEHKSQEVFAVESTSLPDQPAAQHEPAIVSAPHEEAPHATAETPAVEEKLSEPTVLPEAEISAPTHVHEPVAISSLAEEPEPALVKESEPVLTPLVEETAHEQPPAILHSSEPSDVSPVVDIIPEAGIIPPVAQEAPTHPQPVVSQPIIPFIPSPTMATIQPVSGERATAQLTLSLEVSSLQLTPAFKLGSVQLRPLSNVVSLQLGAGAGPQSAANPLAANISFEIQSVQTGNDGQIQSLVLKPLTQARADTTPHPRLQVDAVQLTRGIENAPIQITPAQATSTAVQLLTTYAIAGIDFTPNFEIGTMRLEPSTRTVLLRINQPGAAELPPAFEIANVQVGNDGQINMMQLTPTTI